MSTNPFLAQLFMEERVVDTLRESKQARLAKIVQEPKGTRPFLFAAIHLIRDWWSGGNGCNQTTIDNMKQRKKHQNLAG
jgi:hypothetical protein